MSNLFSFKQKLESYLKITDYSLLLYNKFYEEINNQSVYDNRLIIFEFKNPKSILNWLKYGNKTNIKFIYIEPTTMLTSNSLLNLIHRNMIKLCDSIEVFFHNIFCFY